MTYAFVGPGEPLAALLGVLRGAALVHQTHHWQTRGPSYYGDHLLFERIYTESQPGIDEVAERAVGTGDLYGVGARRQAERLQRFVGRVTPGASAPKPGDLVMISHAAEREVIACINAALAVLERQGKLTAGTRNLLEGLSDKHEQFLYLLQQRAYGRAS